MDNVAVINVIQKDKKGKKIVGKYGSQVTIPAGLKGKEVRDYLCEIYNYVNSGNVPKQMRNLNWDYKSKESLMNARRIKIRNPGIRLSVSITYKAGSITSEQRFGKKNPFPEQSA